MAGSERETAFLTAIERHRRELTAHCYRMLGSLQDAEELAQETLLRAWQRREESASSGTRRAWLFAIATTACLDALRKSRRRRARAQVITWDASEVATWVQPAPDALFESDVLAGSEQQTPDALTSSREHIGLAFVTALQLLSPKQRAAVLLVDVLGWRAEESAALLGTTTTSIHSLLQRARKTLQDHQRAPSDASSVEAPALLRAFLASWENGDVEGLVSLLAEDVRLSMPPEPESYQGRAAAAAFLAPFVRDAPTTYRFRPVAANGEAAVALYHRTSLEEPFRASGISVLTFAGGRISTITRYGVGPLFDRFGLPAELPAQAP